MWKKIRREKRGHQADSGKLSHYEVSMSGAGVGRGVGRARFGLGFGWSDGERMGVDGGDGVDGVMNRES